MHIDKVLRQIQNERLFIERDLAVGNRKRARRQVNLALSLLIRHLRKPEPELYAWFRIVANLARVDRPLVPGTQMDLFPKPKPVNEKHKELSATGSSPPRCRRMVGGEFITQDRSVLDSLRMLEKLALTDLPVLLEGESGTGKEVLARAIHSASRRNDSPWVAINCGAIPPHLQESELFGHARGAFTGATMEKPGLFEVASGGTLFLDEIGEMDPQAQVKLLRVLETGEIRRLGEVKLRRIDVRILAATNAQVDRAVARKRFRGDLLFRLGAIRVLIPPLRERVCDIMPLATHFMSRASSVTPVITPGAQSALVSYHWPGNARELKFTIERVLALWEQSQGGEITTEMLFPQESLFQLNTRHRGIEIGRHETPDRYETPDRNDKPDQYETPRRHDQLDRFETCDRMEPLPPGESLESFLAGVEKTVLSIALKQASGNRTRAAELLGGLSRTTLISKMKRLGLFEPANG